LVVIASVVAAAGLADSAAVAAADSEVGAEN
jgi:ABC-type proline/glycine betaine transport system permease subunit